MARALCVGDWKFVEVKVAGKFPPVSLTRKCSGITERVDCVASRYGVKPHIRVIVSNEQSGETFKMGIVLNFHQVHNHDSISFTNVQLMVGLDGDAPTDQQFILIDAIFAHLYHNYSSFLDKLRRFCYADLKKIVARQVTQ